MTVLVRLILAAILLGTVAARPLHAQDRPAEAGDIPTHFDFPPGEPDFDKREVMIPMRDGVRLHTVIFVPRGAAGAPILLTRTPYDAEKSAFRAKSPHMLMALPRGDEAFVRAGYIRVYQDVRGKYGSEGVYVVTRPVTGPLNPTPTDHSTDAWDTIDWLVNKANLPESNGRVGMIGSSYNGFAVVMALLKPHPALKVAAAESPMVDGWMGDDWFHFGAFRLANIDWIGSQTGYKADGKSLPTGGWDDYDNFRERTLADWAHHAGYDQLPFWRTLAAHPAYDSFWAGQALDRLVAANPSNVPTLWLQGLWDQEDIRGAITTWEALKAKGKAGSNVLLIGPWRHSQIVGDGRTLGPFTWNGDTAQQARDTMILPFFNRYLKDGPAFEPAPVTLYNSAENRWNFLRQWPLACDTGCAAPLTPVFLQDDGALDFAKGKPGEDSYVSDPAKPVPHLPRPINLTDGRWREWLVQDQRFVDGRPDVMTYRTPVLAAPLRVSGVPLADIYARTTGTDGDFVVKLIDVYPPEDPVDPKMGGYQLAISLDIFRGRYRESFSAPIAIPAGKVQRYRFRLPPVNHVFLPGHRMMVQIQSSLFPVYDRNPQTFVPNIFAAQASDFRKATIGIERGGENASAVWLPVVTAEAMAAAAVPGR